MKYSISTEFKQILVMRAALVSNSFVKYFSFVCRKTRGSLILLRLPTQRSTLSAQRKHASGLLTYLHALHRNEIEYHKNGEGILTMRCLSCQKANYCRRTVHKEPVIADSNFAPGAATWRTRRNVRVVFDSIM